MRERTAGESMPGGTWLCLGLMVLCALATAVRASFDFRGGDDRSEVTLSFRGNGLLPETVEVGRSAKRALPVGERDGRPLIVASRDRVELELRALRLVGHDDAMQFLLYVRADGLLETGPSGEPVFYAKEEEPARFVRLFLGEAPQPAP